MSYRPHGKHIFIDESAPFGLGICDKTQFVYQHKDLVKQMEWRGNALVWTGFMVGFDQVDTPNEQLRPPIFPPDPVPLLLPRVEQVSPTGQPYALENPGVDQRSPSPGPLYTTDAPQTPPMLSQNQIRRNLQNFNWRL